MIRKERFMSITAASLEKYLLFKEWKRDNNFKNEKLMVFGWKGESLVIPASEKYKDFYMVLPDVITTLAEIYNKPVSDIIKEITTSYFGDCERRCGMKIIFDSEEQKDSYIRCNCCADFVDVKERCREGADVEECKRCFEKYIEMEVEHGIE